MYCKWHSSEPLSYCNCRYLKCLTRISCNVVLGDTAVSRDKIINLLFHFQEVLPQKPPLKLSQVSSNPTRVCICINDLPDCVLNSTMLLFADDAKCSLPISRQSDCLLLQHDLDVLKGWSKHWNLFFNESKCSLVRFGLHMSSSSQINSCEIQSDSQHKDLGVIVSSNLSWSNQSTI